MPLIASQNPWLTAAGIADNGGNQLAQTLLRLPALRQQLQAGALQNQLLQGQVSFAPQLQQAQLGQYQARTGAEQARGKLYGAEAAEHQGKVDAATKQATSLEQLQDTIRKAVPFMVNGQQIPAQLQVDISSQAVGLPPQDWKTLSDTIMQTLRFSNPSLMKDPRGLLSPSVAARGVNVTSGAMNQPPGGGEPVRADVKLTPGQIDIDANTGQVIGNNPNVGGSKSSALENTLFKSLTADGVLTPQQAAAVVPQLIATMHGMTNSPTGATNAPPRISTKQQRDALAPGTTYIGPDGQPAIKQ